MAALDSPARLAALERWDLVEEGREEAFDRCARLASELLGVPIALVSLVDDRAQRFKGAVGVEVLSTPLSHSFCRHVVEDEAPLVIADARTDARLQGNPAIAELGVVAYCGAPLRDRDGQTLGALCAIATRPRRWRPREVRVLQALAQTVIVEIELRAANRALAAAARQHELIASRCGDALVTVDAAGLVCFWNPAAARLFGFTESEALGAPLTQLIVPVDTRERFHQLLADRLRAGEMATQGGPVELRACHRDGRELIVEASLAVIPSPEGPRLHAVLRDLTARRAAEAERIQLARAMRSSADAVVTIDRQGVVTSANAGAERLYGTTAEKLIGRSVMELTGSPSERQRVGKIIARLLAGERVTTRALPHLRGDGATIYVDVEAAPLLDESGAIVGAISSARDVTEQHLLERQLAASEERLRLTLEGAPIGMAIVATDGRWLRVNRALCQIFGYRADEMLAMTFQQVTAPDDLDGDMALVRSVLAGEIPDFRIQRRYRHRDGHGVWVNLSVSLVRDREGRPLHFVAQVEDISERLERERQNRRLATIVAQSEDAIIAVDRDGTITDWNLGAEHLYGHPADRAVGAPSSILAPRDKAAEQRALLARALAGEAVSAYRTTHVRRDGRPVEVNISLSPLRDSAGAISGASLIARDITARIAEERARRAVEQQLRVTVEHAPIGVGLVALGGAGHGRLVSGNPALARLLALEGRRPEGVRLSAHVHARDAGRLEAELRRMAAHAGPAVQLEVRVAGVEDGWLLIALAPVPDERGRPRQAVLHAIDIGERKRHEAQLSHLADHDALTGLFNRHRFESELRRAVAHAARYHERGALLVVDLDGFKNVNDTMGHSQGDRLVATVGGLLTGALRESDVVARIGGDEFAVIAPRSDEREALAIAAKLLRSMREKAIVFSERGQACVTCSIGVTTFAGEPGVDAEELMAQADIAMYQAKEAGRNQVCAYRPEEHMIDRIRRREGWVERLRSGVEDGAFELFAQPIRPLRARGGERYELLLRMRGEDGEPVAPAVFLADAERMDLIQRIDRWVFAHGAALLHEHHARGRRLALCVNMSAKTLGDPAILADLEAILAATPIPPGSLVVEVTETAAITNIERACEVARGLRELGCSFALDDFGAGFASFYYLKHLEFDFLKIDGEFVASLLHSSIDQLVVRAVVQIARGMGAQTIAECVADEESLVRLRELGVDYAQGYHLGGPVALERALGLTAAV
jgi:diguanylate cyclase (GGDEF)-like protein/PAS domain S-box-containing protein